MLLVIELPDDSTPEAIRFELGLLTEDNDRVARDYPEDLAGALALRTENVQVAVTRIVGIAHESLIRQKGLYRIENLTGR
jgi:hypothetical protein